MYKAGIVYVTAASGITTDDSGKLNKYKKYQEQMSYASKTTNVAAGANNFAQIFWSTGSIASDSEGFRSQVADSYDVTAGNVHAKATTEITADHSGDQQRQRRGE